MQANRSDAVIDEIRQVRHRISERCSHDPDRLVAYYMELQQRFSDRLLDQHKSSVQSDPSAA